MRRLEEYVSAGGRLLRCGYTTGTCAAAAARAAAELLLAGAHVPAIQVSTPAGIDVVVEVEEAEQGADWARAAVRKDAGDDPDVTDGVLVWARVSRAGGSAIIIEGGEGVGRVTKPGLDQPVGSAAINSVPRAMIADAVQASLDEYGCSGGLMVEISIPEGRELAARTFNPRLGIEGGISVLGTSGIVRPMSEEALVASVQLELSMLHAAGVRDLLVVPGNYGRGYAVDVLGLSGHRLVSCSNYVGATIDEAGRLGFATLLIVGHIGKMAKVAAGAMNTHSRVADGRMETMAAHAARVGASAGLVGEILDASTTDAALDLVAGEGLLGAMMDSLMARLATRLRERAARGLAVEAAVFSKVHGLLGMTSGAAELMELHRAE